MLLLFLACAGPSTETAEKPDTDALTDIDGDGVEAPTDCDDADATVFPGAPEHCDDRDEDCDGEIDEDAIDPTPWITDADGDGVGGGTLLACDPPVDAVEIDGDCDDADATVFPGAPEIVEDGTDQDCDGSDRSWTEQHVTETGVEMPEWDVSAVVTDEDGFSVLDRFVAVTLLETTPEEEVEDVATRAGLTVAGVVPEVGYWFALPAPTDAAGLAAVVATLRSDPRVEHAATEKILDGWAAVPDQGTGSAGWHLATTRWDQAWDAAGALPLGEVTVGVVDSQFDLDHTDLDDRYAGFAADWTGPTPWDYGNGRPLASNDDPAGDLFHGTHVTGLIVATRDEVGVNGVAPTASVFPTALFGAGWFGGSWASDSLAPAVTDAVHSGARVINLSLGHNLGAGATCEWAESELPLIYKTLVAAAEGRFRFSDGPVLVVVAAGNDEVDGSTVFPACIPEMLTVGATGPTDARWSDSNYGDVVDLAAPGESVYSTLPGASDAFGVASGTSMAAPIVSGAAALLLQVNPSLTADDLRTLLTCSAHGIDVTAGDADTRWPRLDIAQALREVRAVGPDAPAPVTPMDAENAHGDSLRLSWAAPTMDDEGVELTADDQLYYLVWLDGTLAGAVEPGASLEYALTGLEGGRTYTWQVSAHFWTWGTETAADPWEADCGGAGILSEARSFTWIDAADWDDDDDGYSEAGGDCNDHDASISPLAPETCDEVDENCDGVIDEGFPTEAWLDDDGDGFGTGTVYDIGTCLPVPGWARVDGDCADLDPSTYPGAPEVCDDHVDGDCDGVIDGDCAEDCADGADDDGDGLTDCADPACADAEICLPGPLRDMDGDGYRPVDGDCDDDDPARSPGLPEVTGDGIDDDCDGAIDEDYTLRAVAGVDDDYVLVRRGMIEDAEGRLSVIAYDGGSVLQPTSVVLWVDVLGDATRVDLPEDVASGLCVLAGADPLRVVCSPDYSRVVAWSYDVDRATWTAADELGSLTGPVYTLDAEEGPEGLDVAGCGSTVSLLVHDGDGWRSEAAGATCAEVAVTHDSDGTIWVAVTSYPTTLTLYNAPASGHPFGWAHSTAGVAVTAAPYAGVAGFYASGSGWRLWLTHGSGAWTDTWFDTATSWSGAYDEAFLPDATGGCALVSVFGDIEERCVDGTRTVLVADTFASATGLRGADGSVYVAYTDLPTGELRVGREDGGWSEAPLGESVQVASIAADGDSVAWIQRSGYSETIPALRLDGIEADASLYLELQADGYRDGLLSWTADPSSLGLLDVGSGVTSVVSVGSLACGGVAAPRIVDREVFALATWMSCSYGGGGWTELVATDGTTVWVEPVVPNTAIAASVAPYGGDVAVAWESGGVVTVATRAGTTLATWSGALVELVEDPTDGSLVALYTRDGDLWLRRVATGDEEDLGPSVPVVDAEVDSAGQAWVALGDDGLTLVSGTPEWGVDSELEWSGPVDSVDLAVDEGLRVWFTDSDGAWLYTR